MPEDNHIYDVFISYSHANKGWVWDWLIPKLKEEGFSICTDREFFDVGVPSIINMENAVMASRHTILVLTPAYLESQWAGYEELLVRGTDPIGLRQRTLPVLYELCNLPPRLQMLTYVNLTGEEDVQMEFDKLCRALRGRRSLPDASASSPASTATSPRPTGSGIRNVSIGGNVSGSVIVTGDGNVVGSNPQDVAFVPSQVTGNWNISVVRALLTAALDDESVTTLCFDYFYPVYDRFAAGMTKSQKIQQLLEFCRRNDQVDKLVKLVEKLNPSQYRRFSSDLRR